MSSTGATAATFSMDDYGAVGFDLDHTLVRYKMDSLYRMLEGDLRAYLNSKGLLLAESPNGLPGHFLQKGLVVDGAKGALLKLDAEGRVDRAFVGGRSLIGDSAAQLYGNRPAPWALDSSTPPNDWGFFGDAFCIPAERLYAQLVATAAAHGANPGTLWSELHAGLISVFRIGGPWATTLLKTPGDLVYRCSDKVVSWIRTLRSSGRRIFLLSSAYPELAESVASHCLGADWKDLFDLLMLDACKPGFFTGTQPFFVFDSDACAGGDAMRPLRPDESLQSGVMYVRGNWQDLSNLWLGPSCRTLYVGDSLRDDLLGAHGLCDTVAIVEELASETAASGYDGAECLRAPDCWGSPFAGASTASRFTSVLCSSSKVVTSSVDELAALAPGRRISAFDGRTSLRGFYPAPPRSLKMLLEKSTS